MMLRPAPASPWARPTSRGASHRCRQEAWGRSLGTLKGLVPKVTGLPRLGRLVGFLSAVGAVLAVAAVQASVLRQPSIAPFVLFFLAVAGVSSLAGRRPGLLTVGLSAATANYEFIAPFGAWSTSPEALIATGFFTVAASATALLCGSLREALDRVEEREVLWRTVFQHAPSPLWEEDFSAVAARFQALRADGVRDLAAYLKERPGEVTALAALVRVRRASDSTFDVLGGAIPAGIAARLSAGVDAPAAAVLALALVALWRGETRFEAEIPLADPRGKRGFFQLRLSVVPGCEQSLARVLTSLQDLTALRESELDLSRAQAVAHTGSWRLDVRRNELRWSDETYRIFGKEQGAARHYETFLDAVHPADRGFVDRAWQAALHGEPYDVEHRILVRGAPRWVRVRAQLEVGEDGTLYGVFGTVQDVSEQKQAQEAVRRSEERFRTMFESAGAGIAQVDLHTWRFVRVNRRFAAITGYSQAELETMSYLELTHPDERADAEAGFARIQRGEIRDDYLAQRRYLRKGGEAIDLELYGSVVRDADGRPADALIVVVDVTTRKRWERELAAAKLSAERAKAAAEEASRAKDHFLAVLSHELRTPLTPVLTSVSLLESDGSLPGETRQYLEVIRRNVELEARLIDDLLDLTRITRGKVELDRRVTELCTIIERAVEVCRPEIDARRLRFTVDYGTRPYVLYADAARLQQVFWNVLKNAIKFTPQEGRVGVRCHPEEGCVVVEVEDSGVGIEPSALGSIFDAFTQAQPSITRQFGGLGLGLAISRNLTEMHGGSIEAYSDGPGQGACFRVRLPIVSCGAETATPAPRPALRTRPPARRGVRVLLVEDHPDTAETMVAMLELAGYEVATAADVATALATLAPGGFDLLVSDLGLPDRSGLDLLRELRARGAALPAIALSGYGQESDITQSRDAGFDAHLVKPVEPRRLLEVMEKLVARAGVRSPLHPA
jgi:PAS domain S-box-containing protein